jgi:hypothetical protein
MVESPLKPLSKKAKKGFQGYPLATIAFYGPDATRATKIAVAIINVEGAEPSVLDRWFVEIGDVRINAKIGKAVVEFVRLHAVKSVVMTDGIIGCPHEEGSDYPTGQACPQVPLLGLSKPLERPIGALRSPIPGRDKERKPSVRPGQGLP